MKVLMVVPSLRKTGVTEVIKSLILENNKEKKVEYELVALREGYPEQEKVFEDLVKLHVFPSKTIFSLSQVSQLNKLIKRSKPDIIHFHGFNSEIYIPWIKTNDAKIMVTAHNMGKEDFTFTYCNVIGLVMSLIQRKIYKKIDLLVCVSNTVNEHYQHLGFKKIVTIYNGVSLPNKYDTEIKSKNHEVPVGIYVGNLDKRKNVDKLLVAFSKLKEQKLIILGDNPKISEILKKYKEKYSYSNIVFLGRVANVYKYLEQADYFISASLAEGLPMAAIEAMGMNLDLVLSNISQHKELKKYNKQDIILFNKSNLDQTLNAYYKKWNKTHVSNNKEVFFTYFSSNVMYRNYVNEYENIVKK